MSTYSAVNWLVTDGTQIIGIKTYDGTYESIMPRSNADIMAVA